MSNEIRTENVESYNDDNYNEMTEIKQTMKGYFAVMGSLFIGVVFLIVIFIQYLSRM
jgi:hypothetical protein